MVDRSKAGIAGVAVLALLVLWAAHRHAVHSLPDLPDGTVAVEGVVTYVRPIAGGGWLVQLKAHGGTRTLLLSPRLGELAHLVRKGDVWRAVGTVRSWRDKSYLEPVSRAHLRRLAPFHQQEIYSESSLATLGRLPEGARVRVRARPASVRIYRSRAGKSHLVFELRDDTGSCSAIMWEGTYTPADEALLGKGVEVTLFAEVDEYRGKPSLVVRGVE